MPIDDDPIFEFATQKAWAVWLAKHHATATGVWIKCAKKSSGLASVTPPEALDIALCYGWIDATRRGLDETYFLQRYAPRASRSKWSKINREKVAELIDQGRMKPAGLREIERAKADGRWEAAYDAQSKATVPEDLERAFAKSKAARAFFATLDSRNRFAVLHRVQTAKKPETRARRIATFVEMLAEGKKIYP